MDADIREVAERLGARLKRCGLERVGACPVCGGTDRFSVNPAKGVWNCRGCGVGGDAIDLVRHVLRCGFNEAREFVGDEPRSRKLSIDAVVRDAFRQPLEASGRPSDDGQDERTAAALALWAASVDPRETPVESYLRSRNLDVGDDMAGEVLRWHPGISAMVALFRDILTDEPRAVSRTFLSPDGRKLERKFLGPVGGCAVKLDADDTVLAGLHVGEGVETCLAARQLGLKPAWALGSAGEIAKFPVLSGVECLTILAERCDRNAEAIESCAPRWHAAGRQILINRSVAGKDLNDALLGAST